MIEFLKSKIFKLSATIILPLILLSLSSEVNVGYGFIDGNLILVGAALVAVTGIYITFFKK